MEALNLTLPWPPRALSSNARKHWAIVARAKKDYRAECYLITKQAIREQGYTVPEHCTQKGSLHVFIDFYPPDRRRRDDDNPAGAFKAGRDGVAQALGCDDYLFRSHPFLHDEPVKGGKVVVRITERLDQ